METKIENALNGILQLFESGKIPEAVSLAVFPKSEDIPSANWSLLNRTLMILGGTDDARGFNQWKKAGRYVKKGSKSICILAPNIKKKTEEKENGEKEEENVLVGFLAVSVFKVEDTDGEPLDYQQLTLPPLPLIEVAEAWGISTKPIGGHVGFLGRFSQGRQLIALASPEESVFFHELGHAAHGRIRPLKGGQHWNQEIVAELTAAVLCRLAGRQPENMGQHFQYIRHYAEKAGKDPVKACLEVFSDTEKTLKLILGQQSELTPPSYAKAAG